MTDEYQIDNVTWAEKDSSGNIVVDSDVVNTEKIDDEWRPKTASELSTAVSEINTNNGGRLVLPFTGKNSPLDVSGVTPLSIDTDDVIVEGYGPEATRLDTVGSTLFSLTNTTYQNVYFRDFRVDSGTGNALDLRDWHATARNVHVQGTGGVGFDCRGCFSAEFVDCLSKSNTVNWAFQDLSGTGNTNAKLIQSNSVSASGSASVTWDATNSNIDTPQIMGCLFEKNDNRDVTFKGVDNPVVAFSRFSRADQTDSGSIPHINITDDGNGNNTTDGRIVYNEIDGSSGPSTNPTAYGILLSHVDASGSQSGLHITGNWFREHGAKAVNFGTDVADVWIDDNAFTNVNDAYDEQNGVRTVIRGWGVNSGNPSSAGDWNGAGYEGVMVWDTSNNISYAYVPNSVGWVNI